MKKVLSLVLVIAMVLSSFSFAFAAPKFEDIADTDYAKAIETLVALGVVTGYEDGTFRPERTVTRAEMAKLIVEILGYGDLVAGSKSNFTDTQGHWADAWIALAAGRGLVIGTGEGKFTPDRTVSYDEAITMVVRALGYTDASNELKNMSWPTNFKVKAAELGLTKDVKLAADGADRGGVAQLLYNALTATLVTVNSDGDVIKATTQTTDSDGKVVVNYTELLSRLATYKGSYVVDLDTLDEDSKFYGGDIVDLEPYLYQNLKVYLNDDDEVVYVKGTNSLVVEGTVTDVLNAAGNSVVGSTNTEPDVTRNAKATLVVEDANEKEYKLVVPAISGDQTTNEVKAYYNGDQDYLDVDEFEAKLYDNSAAKVTVVLNDRNGNGKVDSNDNPVAMIVEKATKGILVNTDYVGGRSRITGVSGTISLPVASGKVDADNIEVIGAVDSLDDIEADDVVVEYKSLNRTNKDSFALKLVVVRDSVEGSITRTNSTSSTVFIDGKEYKRSSILGAVAGSAISVNDEGIFYLDNAGKVFAVDTETELVDYAIVLGAEAGSTKTSFSVKDVKDHAQLKLATSKGETVVYDILTTFDNSVIDEVAKLNKTTPLVKLTANLIPGDGALNVLTIDPAVTTPDTIVKYSLDSDGNIDAIEVVAYESNVKLFTEDLDVTTTDNTVVFDKTDKYNVVSVNNLKKDAEHFRVAYFTTGANKGKVAVILTNNAESVNSGVYGVISGLNYTQNSSGDKVVEVTALVNGEKVTFLTGKNKLTGDFTRTTTNAAFRFEFNSSDLLLSVENIVPGSADDLNVEAFVDATIAEVDATGMKVDTVQKFFANDVVVYIYDESADSIRIGDVYDILDSDDANEIATSAYVLDKTESTRIGIVVQVVK